MTARPPFMFPVQHPTLAEHIAGCTPLVLTAYALWEDELDPHPHRKALQEDWAFLPWQRVSSLYAAARALLDPTP